MTASTIPRSSDSSLTCAKPPPTRAGQLRQGAAQLLDPGPVQFKGREAGFGEVPIILCELLAPLREGPLLRLRPAPGFLHHRPTGLDNLYLAFDLELDRAVQRAE